MIRNRLLVVRGALDSLMESYLKRVQLYTAVVLSGIVLGQFTSMYDNIAQAQTPSSPANPSQITPEPNAGSSSPLGSIPTLAPLDVKIQQEQKPYVLGPGDKIKIEVFNLPDFSGEHQVLPDGSVTLPQVGSVNLQGMTLQQAGSELSFRMSAFLKLPIVNVSLINARSLRVAVVGEVNKPGAYTIGASGEKTTVPTLTQLIQTAGGITPRADIRRIQVRRAVPGGVEQNLNINLWDLVQSGDLQKDLPLSNGDSIVVPPATSINPAEATLLATTNFSPSEISVNIVGQVERPGQVKLNPNTPMNQAILAAGGFNSSSNSASVELIRLNPDGSVTRREIPVDFGKGINDQTNPTLQNTDIIIVKQNAVTNVTDTIDTFLGPLLDARTLVRLFRDGF